MTPATDPMPANPIEPALPEGTWGVDPQRSDIGFAVKEMWGLRTVTGTFKACEGRLTVRAGNATGELTLEVDSVDTGDKTRDKHLRSPAFFDVERHPRIKFVTTEVTEGAGGLKVIGKLAVGSSLTRLEIPVTVERLPDGALRLEGETTVSRKAAGVSWNMLGMIRDDTILHAKITLERPTTDGRPQ